MEGKLISIEEVVDTASTIIKPSDDTDRLTMRQWVWMGVQELGPSVMDTKTCTLYPTDDLKLRKPDDLLQTTSIALYTANGNELFYRYRGQGSRIHIQTGEYTATPVDLSDDEHYFILGDNAEGLVERAELKYIGIPLDDAGLPKILEEDLFALVTFLKFMYSWADGSNQSEVQNNKLMWEQERRKRRSARRAITPLAADEILRRWQTLIPAKPHPRWKHF
jgi:hypothetical protein